MVAYVKRVKAHRERQLALLNAAIAADYRVCVNGHAAAQMHHAALTRHVGGQRAGQYEQQGEVQGED